MRVATFNIHHGTVGEKGPVDADQLAEVCRSFEADVIAFQEVEQGTPRTWRVDLVGTVARACSMQAVSRPAQCFGLGWQGNALLVRGEILRSAATGLPRVPAWKLFQERRMVLDADVRIDGRPWSVTTTHLAVDPVVGSRQLDAVLAGRAGRVVLGDLNLEGEAVRSAAVRAGLTDVAHGPTYPAQDPRVAIDHVLLPAGVAAVSVEVRRTPMSDHAALIVDLDREAL